MAYIKQIYFFIFLRKPHFTANVAECAISFSMNIINVLALLLRGQSNALSKPRAAEQLVLVSAKFRL